jgi:hypothetical protein
MAWALSCQNHGSRDAFAPALNDSLRLGHFDHSQFQYTALVRFLRNRMGPVVSVAILALPKMTAAENLTRIYGLEPQMSVSIEIRQCGAARPILRTGFDYS